MKKDKEEQSSPKDQHPEVETFRRAVKQAKVDLWKEKDKIIRRIMNQ